MKTPTHKQVEKAKSVLYKAIAKRVVKGNTNDYPLWKMLKESSI